MEDANYAAHLFTTAGRKLNATNLIVTNQFVEKYKLLYKQS